jgi:hypothetical protein
MLPTNDEVTPRRIMSMPLEFAALEFEFDSNPLKRPFFASQFCVAIRKAPLNALDDKAQLGRKHSEEKHDTLFIDWRVPQAAKIENRAIPSSYVTLMEVRLEW